MILELSAMVVSCSVLIAFNLSVLSHHLPNPNQSGIQNNPDEPWVPDEPWDWRVLDNLTTMKDIMNNPDKPWDWEYLSEKPFSKYK